MENADGQNMRSPRRLPQAEEATDDVTTHLMEDEDVAQAEVAAPARRASRRRSPPPRAASPPARSSRRRSPPPRTASPPQARAAEEKPKTRHLPLPQEEVDDELPSLIEATDISEPEVTARAGRKRIQSPPPPVRASRQHSPRTRAASPAHVATEQIRESRRLPLAQDSLSPVKTSRPKSPPPRLASPARGVAEQKHESRSLPPAQEDLAVADAQERSSRRLPPAQDDTDVAANTEAMNDETVSELEPTKDADQRNLKWRQDGANAKRDDSSLKEMLPPPHELRPSAYQLNLPQEDTDATADDRAEIPARRSRASVFADDIRPLAANTSLTAGATQPPLVSKLAAEFVGVFLLVLTVGVSRPAKNDYAPIAIGLMLSIQVYNYAAVSGGMFNPAVTLAVLLSGRQKITLANALLYMLTQLVAAILAAFVSLGITQETLFFDYDASRSSLVHGGAGTSFLMEFFFTCALCNTVLHAGTSRDTPNDYAGFAIGCSVVAGAIASGENSQASFNPALTVGMNIANYARKPSADAEDNQIFYPSFGSWVVYLAAPFLGAALASLCFRIIRSSEYAADEASCICEKPSVFQKATAECCGTFFLVLTVGTAGTSEGALAPIGIGLMLAVQVYTFGAVSGGLFNPAVSFAVMLSGRKKLTPQGWLAYTSAQCCGALAAALVAIAMVERSFFFKTYVASTTPQTIRVGGFCTEQNSDFNGDWTFSGTTVAGAPYWRKDVVCNEAKEPTNPLWKCTENHSARKTLFLYWDRDCNGNGAGDARWIFDTFDVNLSSSSIETSSVDLDKDGACAYDARIDSPSGVPPLGFSTWKERCPRYEDARISLFEVPRDDSQIHRWWAGALLSEILFTCSLASIVLAAGTSYDAPNEYFGFAIGGVVIAGAYSCNGLYAASFNPAVTFGINLAHGHGQAEGPSLDSWLLFILGPMLGGSLAGGLFYATRLQEVQDFWARECETVGGLNPESKLETE